MWTQTRVGQDRGRGQRAAAWAAEATRSCQRWRETLPQSLRGHGAALTPSAQALASRSGKMTEMTRLSPQVRGTNTPNPSHFIKKKVLKMTTCLMCGLNFVLFCLKEACRAAGGGGSGASGSCRRQTSRAGPQQQGVRGPRGSSCLPPPAVGLRRDRLQDPQQEEMPGHVTKGPLFSFKPTQRVWLSQIQTYGRKFCEN